jgi:hypothetical protein
MYAQERVCGVAYVFDGRTIRNGHIRCGYVFRHVEDRLEALTETRRLLPVQQSAIADTQSGTSF